MKVHIVEYTYNLEIDCVFKFKKDAQAYIKKKVSMGCDNEDYKIHSLKLLVGEVIV